MGRPAFEPQRVLAGRYRLEERLSGGGMGAIWRAEHLTLQAPVAVKLIDRDAVHDEQTVARFLREAKAAAALRSPHVVQILDYGMDDGVPFIVMELLEGETLAQRLKRVRRLTATDTARFVSHVGRAVGRAHEAGIVHRDLKPENVFIVHNEDEDIAKVLDFGVAKVEHGVLSLEGERTQTGSILGTPYYMSPEQAQGNKAVDHRSDLWSLGVIAFECLTGKRPFYSDGLGDLVLQICVRELPVPSEVAAVPIGFDAWFAKAVARDPDARFQSAREMSDALREALCIEARDVRASQPEILISTADGEPRSVPAPVSRANTRKLEGPQDPALAERALLATATPGSSPRSSAAPDPSAATVAAPPERVVSDLEQAPPASLPPVGSGLGSIVAVAAVALGLGLGGGIWALQHFGKVRLENGAPSSGERVPSEPRVHRPNATRRPNTRRDAINADASTPGLATTANATQTAHPNPNSSSARERHDSPGLDAGIRGSVLPDGGWVKPEWAIPDPEPRRTDDDPAVDH
jgi:serine/threonine-protein kinase